jgi:hypothetical protein
VLFWVGLVSRSLGIGKFLVKMPKLGKNVQCNWEQNQDGSEVIVKQLYEKVIYIYIYW